jgi:hypothetical protein
MNKIDLIIDALECAVSDEMFELGKYEAALAAAREIRELQPAAWMAWNMPDDQYEITTDKRRLPAGTPLYALDEVTK